MRKEFLYISLTKEAGMNRNSCYFVFIISKIKLEIKLKLYQSLFFINLIKMERNLKIVSVSVI